jgi:hypothetical protein
MDEKELNRWNFNRGLSTGMFEALLLTRCMQDISDGLKQVKVFVRVHEFEEAFDSLTAIIANRNLELSEDAWAILEHLGERLRAKPENWHGLQRK